MARVTVEDCIDKVPNRFELVMLAAQRARDLSSGAKETVERDNDKPPVIALREIADRMIDFDEVLESLVVGLQKHVTFDDPEEEEPDMTVLAGGAEVLGAPVEIGGTADDAESVEGEMAAGEAALSGSAFADQDDRAMDDSPAAAGESAEASKDD